MLRLGEIGIGVEDGLGLLPGQRQQTGVAEPGQTQIGQAALPGAEELARNPCSNV